MFRNCDVKYLPSLFCRKRPLAFHVVHKVFYLKNMVTLLTQDYGSYRNEIYETLKLTCQNLGLPSSAIASSGMKWVSTENVKATYRHSQPLKCSIKFELLIVNWPFQNRKTDQGQICSKILSKGLLSHGWAWLTFGGTHCFFMCTERHEARVTTFLERVLLSIKR